MNPVRVAKANLQALSTNPYTGRDIIVGMNEGGEEIVQVYRLSSRSEYNRNRVLISDNGRVFAEAADPSKMKDDPSLIIYCAMSELPDLGMYVVSNGAQTDGVISGFRNRNHTLSMMGSLESYEYEPDQSSTPRITCACSIFPGNFFFELAILRRSVWPILDAGFGGDCDRFHYRYRHIGPGIGLFISTYETDGDPLPPFRGEPLLMPLAGSIEQIADTYWKALNRENGIALAVKFINIQSGESKVHIINRYHKINY